VGSPFGNPVVVANPKAGRGAVANRIHEIERALEAQGLSPRTIITTGPQEATIATREALRLGDTFIVAVGGDGTIHEVVNGMFEDGKPIVPQPVLGVIAAGSGCDFIKTFGLPDDVSRACEHIAGANTFAIDVGKVTFAGPDGAPVVRYFPNIAEAGLGGAVVARAARLPRFFGRSRYFFGFWLTLPGFKRFTVTVDTDRRSFKGGAYNVVIANCQFYGSGMRISPRSWPADGYLDVIVMTGPKSDSFTTLPKVYRGEHLPHPHMQELRAQSVRVEADRPLPIEGDGEVLGTTPATFEVVPEAIRVKI
jgi:YegS/Rv2252/BmrU family lipid kinase